MKALITGPNNTPYAHGIYIFDVYFPMEYPNYPPKIYVVNNNFNKIRFGPNFYQDGSICLSLLGNWDGK